MIIDECFFIFLIENLIGFAFGERAVNIFDGFEPDGFGVSAHVEEELLGFHVHGLG